MPFGVERVLGRCRDGDMAPVLYMEALFDQMREVGLLAGRNLVDFGKEHSGSDRYP